MLGDDVHRLPESVLIALGMAGSREYSPFCRLQFLLVHGQTDDAGNEVAQRFAALLHEGFEACGVLVDEAVTPRNPLWRGCVPEWKQRLEKILKRGKSGEVFDMLRLADQSLLDGNADIGSEFRQLSLSALSGNRSAVNSHVSRAVSLSNGIGMMGGLRFEKKGVYRGQFAILDNALLPLLLSVSALGLLKRLETASFPERVREILWRRELNVDMAERLLQAWHTFHVLRLLREREVQPDWSNAAPLYLDIEQMNVSEQEALRESLEAVGTIQRHLNLNFSGSGM
jgi:signal-transduction protein with cAMP-binding, CBS, and nucleotidyltransferase domain